MNKEEIIAMLEEDFRKFLRYFNRYEGSTLRNYYADLLDYNIELLCKIKDTTYDKEYAFQKAKISNLEK